MGLPVRPRAIEDLQAASAVGQGKLYRVYDELLRERGVTQRAGAADVLRHERAHALPQRAPDARQAARLARAAGHQRERHDDDRRDLLRRQRLPRRPGGDAGRRRPARAADRHRRAVHRRPADRPDAPRSSPEVTDFAALERAGDRPHDLAAGSGGMRSKVVAAEMATAARDRDRRSAAGCARARSARRSTAGRVGTRFAPRRGALLLASSCGCKYAKPAHGTVVVDAGAARALREGGTSLLPVGIVEVRGDVRRRRRGRRSRTARSSSARGSATTPPRSSAGQGDEVRARCAR